MRDFFTNVMLTAMHDAGRDQRRVALSFAEELEKVSSIAGARLLEKGRAIAAAAPRRAAGSTAKNMGRVKEILNDVRGRYENAPTEMIAMPGRAPTPAPRPPTQAGATAPINTGSMGATTPMPTTPMNPRPAAAPAPVATPAPSPTAAVPRTTTPLPKAAPPSQTAAVPRVTTPLPKPTPATETTTPIQRSTPTGVTQPLPKPGAAQSTPPPGAPAAATPPVDVAQMRQWFGGLNEQQRKNVLLAMGSAGAGGLGAMTGYAAGNETTVYT